ncbi:uncharacterized protein [Nicotiana sylvestris]|uniref:uncharacterized protein n=1 Tax=Nicotiana sylvestris TaxID=4096 RepID=UPI00388CA50F
MYPISDSSWTLPVQCVLKKGGMTVVTNAQNELIPTRTVTGWRVCTNYPKLNKVTRKDHFPLPFLDQMLDILAGHVFYCFLDGCVPEEEQLSILEAFHSSPYGVHHGGARTTSKVLSCGFYCPTLYKDTSELLK